jgi:hypothetical protein
MRSGRAGGEGLTCLGWHGARAVVDMTQSGEGGGVGDGMGAHRDRAESAVLDQQVRARGALRPSPETGFLFC